ncbi:LacI family DNA-binding transcriptional regulator [Poseidonocella sp. HB161398]|uniref:LacI family DNA-binding transcriptional regulator n=1 Tax=Poseidonocella sp. HB161398 TaxID=2320855 RepID=UPI0011086009|nr:LacI family DNA-binding transcriptional regulator [Poseidonocella sp. HB161398]
MTGRDGGRKAEQGAGRPTVRDVAREAGVSLATVDRVLNERPGVRKVTAKRVADAMARLGYQRDMAAANLSKRRHYRMAFLLAEGTNSFMHMLRDAVGNTASFTSMDRIDLRTVLVPPFDGPALAAALDALDPEEIDGVAVVATDSPEVRDAIARLSARGVYVLTLVSDAPTSMRARFVGIDNVVAGRTAAGLLGRFCPAPGRICIVMGSALLRDHVERRLGFETVIAREYPHLSCLPPIEGRDDAETVGRLLSAQLKAEPGIAGIYNLGAGNRGIVRALEERAAGPRIPVVVHELTPYARSALISGVFDAVINQDAGHEIRSAVRILKALIDGRPTFDAQESICIDIYMRDNLP